jgi:hypothetical protein
MSVDAGVVSDHLCVVWSQIPRLKASMSASRRLFLEEPLSLLPFCRTVLPTLYLGNIIRLLNTAATHMHSNFYSVIDHIFHIRVIM